MPYRAEVNVIMMSEDVTTGKTATVSRKDMHFSVKASDPRDVVAQAKQQFNDRYGPDLVVRSCNLQARDKCLLYCISKRSVQRVMPAAERLIRSLPNASR